MSELRVGLVGCGRLAELGYAPAAELAPGMRIAAVADPDSERRALVAEIVAGTHRDRPSTHASARELIAGGEAEAIVVASPAAQHEEAARAGAEAGMPVLIEKPPAADADAAARIAALDPPPWIGFNRRYSLGRDLSGALPAGGAIELELRYRRRGWAPIAVRDPALLDLAPHLVDLALLAGIGAPVAVRASLANRERALVELSGDRASARIECRMDRPHRERVVLQDARGEVVTRARDGGARGLVRRFARTPHPLVASLAMQLEDFVGAVHTGHAGRLASAAEGAAVMRVIAAAQASAAADGREVAIGGVPAGVVPA